MTTGYEMDGVHYFFYVFGLVFCGIILAVICYLFLGYVFV